MHIGSKSKQTIQKGWNIAQMSVGACIDENSYVIVQFAIWKNEF